MRRLAFCLIFLIIGILQSIGTVAQNIPQPKRQLAVTASQTSNPILSLTPNTDGNLIYTVVANDYLSKIAKLFGTTSQILCIANNLPDCNLIHVGNQLVIPVLTAQPQLQSSSIPPTSTPTLTATAEATQDQATSTLSPTPIIATETQTITLMPLPICPPTPTPDVLTQTVPGQPVVPEDALLFDDFASNKNGWQLTDNAKIINSQLVVTSIDRLNLVIVPIVRASKFSVELDAQIEDALTGKTNAVVAFGALSEGKEFHYISFNNERIDIYQVINGRDRFVYSTQSLVDFNCFQRIGVRYRNNQVEVYLNDNITAIAELPENGDEIGLGTQYWNETGIGTVLFDNLLITQIKEHQ